MILKECGKSVDCDVFINEDKLLDNFNKDRYLYFNALVSLILILILIYWNSLGGFVLTA